MEGTQKIALFIDADNVSSRYGKLIMDNLEQRGEIAIRRIYGNWEKNSLRKWDDFILCYGLRTVQQIDFVTGKNATDMTLAIDAMDVVYTNPEVKTFAIISNDSDFTPLAIRLREHGVFLIGIGTRDSSSFAFKSACSEFIAMESLHEEPTPAEQTPSVDAQIETPQEDEKILALERKIAELERKIASPKWGIALRLATEENKSSALKKSTSKIKQKIICNTFTPSIVETDTEIETVVHVEPAPPADEPVNLQNEIPLEIVPSELKSSSVEMPTDIKGVVVFKPVKSTEQPVKVAKKKSEVELHANNSPTPQTETSATAAVVDEDRARALQQRFVECGMKGMRNPKKKMQQIHDTLRETARLHGDKNGFVPLTFAGQDLKKKNFDFGVQDFGYNFLNEFISDFPELYELTHNKPRSFRYRCL